MADGRLTPAPDICADLIASICAAAQSTAGKPALVSFKTN